MKQSYQSFLIFLFSLCATLSFSQSTQDSLAYYSNIALRPTESSDLIKASKFFNKQRELSINKGDLPLQLNSLFYLSSINQKIGFFEESERLAVEAIELLDQNPDFSNQKAYRKSIYNQLGVLYSQQQNYDKAVELYSRVLEVANNTRDSIIVYNNVGITYKRVDKIEESHLTFLKAFDLTSKTTDTSSIALVFNNLGNIKTKRKDYREARELLIKSLEFKEQINDSAAFYSSYSNLAKFYKATDSIKKAKFYAEKALDFSKKLRSVSYRHDALGLLVDLSPDVYARDYKRLNDSIIKEDKAKSNEYALMRYDYSEFEKKALESELKHQRQQARTTIAVLIGSGIALISILGFLVIRARHRREKLQQVIDTESRISKQVHDEVANNVFQVMTKFESQSYQQSELADELHQLYHKARDISNQHSLIDTSISFSENLEALFESYETSETSFVVKGLANVKWSNFSDIQKNTIYKVLQELLINMKKHSNASLVLLLFENDEKKLKINYSDNGDGADLIKHTGLQNTENRIKTIGGTIIFETQPQKGFKAKIVI